MNKEFIWIDRKGRRMLITRMETKLLFYTLRLIWNSEFPDFRVPGDYPVNQNCFKRREHTKEYLREAMLELTTELVKRDDLANRLKSQFQYMKDSAEKIGDGSHSRA